MNRLIIIIGAVALAACMYGANNSDYKTEDREPIRHTFTGDKTLDVDNVNGSVTVIGDTGTTIRVEGERLIRALNQQNVEQAKRDVTLDINEKDGVAQLYENGPFRGSNDRNSDNHGFHEHRDRDYEVTYNLTIHVPKATELRLHTVNGSLKTDATDGKFDLNSINGTIDMTGVAGSGRADTLNGTTTITFRENPKAESYFKSFNGKVIVTFQPNLSADMTFQTFNGDAYTDFESTTIASPPGTLEQKNGKQVYRSRGSSAVRVGSGGPLLKFETFNGNIQVRKAK